MSPTARTPAKALATALLIPYSGASGSGCADPDERLAQHLERGHGHAAEERYQEAVIESVRTPRR